MPLRDPISSPAQEGGASAKVFFLALAEVLAERQLLDGETLTALTTEIRQEIINPFTADGILTTLARQGSPFLALVHCRYAATTLFANLYRFTAQAPLRAHVAAANRFADALLQRSTLLFNRRMLVGEGAQAERSVLVPSFLLELAQHVLAHAEAVDDVAAALNVLLPADGEEAPGASAGDAAAGLDPWDAAVAARLGMVPGDASALPLLDESLAKNRLAHEATQLGAVLRAAAAQAARNAPAAKPARFQALLDEWRNVAVQLRETTLEAGTETELLELRRLEVLAAVHKLAQVLDALGEEFLGILGQCVAPPKAGHLPLLAHERRLAFDLVKHGHAPDAARRAAADLLTYCGEHGIGADELIAPELARINQSLRESSLALLRDLHRAEGALDQAAPEKERNFGRLARLKEALARLGAKGATTALLFVAVPWALSGCGWKTEPHSDIDDLRPEVPYRSDEAAYATPHPAGTTPRDTVPASLDKEQPARVPDDAKEPVAPSAKSGAAPTEPARDPAAPDATTPTTQAPGDAAPRDTSKPSPHKENRP